MQGTQSSSGFLTPLDMENSSPQYWKNDPEEGGKTLFEAEF
jgi:hypothetical protein